MGVTKIAIIGGGISGLALLHFLTKKYAAQVEIILYESNASTGGHVRTNNEDGFCFETGPNGFLNTHPTTLELISDLELNQYLIKSKTKDRFIQINNQLYPVPTDPLSVLTSSLFSTSEKFNLVKGFLNKSVAVDQSVYAYGKARFGQGVTEKLIDPFVSGIFAGDIKRLHMQSAFEKMLRLQGKRGKPVMCSLKFGMGQLTKVIYERYARAIKLSTVISSCEAIDADHIFCTVPAHAAKDLFAHSNPDLADLLGRIVYAPIAVVGLGFDEFSFKKKPEGFGYLIPFNQGKEILGVLIESNVFEERSPKNRIMLRVMMGGRNHPHVIFEDMRILVERAEVEINRMYGLKKSSVKHWVKTWAVGIAQYELEYPSIVAGINEEIKKTPRVTLLGNYLGGISLNDCITNAKNCAHSFVL